MILTENQTELAFWFAARASLSAPKPMRYIGCEIGGLISFVTAFENFNGASMYIHIAGDGQSRLTKDFVWACFDYAFNHCNAKMLIGPIASGNAPALRVNKHFGFEVSHVIEGAHPDGALVYTILRKENCRFLGSRWSRHAN